MTTKRALRLRMAFHRADIDQTENMPGETDIDLARVKRIPSRAAVIAKGMADEERKTWQVHAGV